MLFDISKSCSQLICKGNKMAKKQVIIRPTEDAVNWYTEEAKRIGIPRGSLILLAMQEYREKQDAGTN